MAKRYIGKPMGAIDVLILAGGMGSRLRAIVSDRPKPMAQVAGRPFLDHVISRMRRSGFKRFVLCTGYMGTYIDEFFKVWRPQWEVVISHELQPLGTGGAIKNARKQIRSDPFLVLNGDSFCPMDYRSFLDHHERNKALVTIALSSPSKKHEGGTVALTTADRITAFEEKAECGPGLYTNAGAYCIDKQLFELMPPEQSFSLEYDLFPALLPNRCFGYLTGKPFVDIGTPERYREIFEERGWIGNGV